MHFSRPGHISNDNDGSVGDTGVVDGYGYLTHPECLGRNLAGSGFCGRRGVAGEQLLTASDTPIDLNSEPLVADSIYDESLADYVPYFLILTNRTRPDIKQPLQHVELISVKMSLHQSLVTVPRQLWRLSRSASSSRRL
jgi:hypothetical protein